MKSISKPSRSSRWRECGATSNALKSKLTGGLFSNGRVLAENARARARTRAYVLTGSYPPDPPAPPVKGRCSSRYSRCEGEARRDRGGLLGSTGARGRRRPNKLQQKSAEIRLTRLTVDRSTVDRGSRAVSALFKAD
jgi:hypothetical protein